MPQLKQTTPRPSSPRLIKKLKKFQPRATPTLMLKDGQTAKTPQQIRDRWKEHAQDTHLGTDSSVQEP